MFLRLAIIYSIAILADASKLSPYKKQNSEQPLNLNECISNKLETVKPYLAEGLPELAIPSLKDILIPYSVVKKNNFEFGLWNLHITGLDNFNVLKVDVKNDLFKFQIQFPYAEGSGSYGCRGNLFNLKFDSTGPAAANATNFILNLELKTRLVQRNGQNYFEQEYRNIDITIEGNLQMNLSNLYPGNTKITDIMNEIVNDNSYYMFEMLIPILENHLDGILEKAIGNIFETYSYSELFP